MEQKEFMNNNDGGWDEIISDTYKESTKRIKTYVIDLGGRLNRVYVLDCSDEELHDLVTEFNEKVEDIFKNEDMVNYLKEIEEYDVIENIIDETTLIEELIFADEDTLMDYGYEDEWFNELFFDKATELMEIDINGIKLFEFK